MNSNRPTIYNLSNLDTDIDMNKKLLKDYSFSIAPEREIKKISKFIYSIYSKVFTKTYVFKLADLPHGSVYEIRDIIHEDCISGLILAGPLSVHYFLFPSLHKLMCASEFNNAEKDRMRKIILKGFDNCNSIVENIDKGDKKNALDGMQLFDKYKNNVLYPNK